MGGVTSEVPIDRVPTSLAVQFDGLAGTNCERHDSAGHDGGCGRSLKGLDHGFLVEHAYRLNFWNGRGQLPCPFRPSPS